MSGRDSLREAIFDQLDGLAKTTAQLVRKPASVGQAAQASIAHNLNEIRYAVGHDAPPVVPRPAPKALADVVAASSSTIARRGALFRLREFDRLNDATIATLRTLQAAALHLRDQALERRDEHIVALEEAHFTAIEERIIVLEERRAGLHLQLDAK